ncbi:8905_t:CDS:2, partial [Funneliformis geosporum]
IAIMFQIWEKVVSRSDEIYGVTSYLSRNKMIKTIVYYHRNDRLLILEVFKGKEIRIRKDPNKIRK